MSLNSNLQSLTNEIKQERERKCNDHPKIMKISKWKTPEMKLPKPDLELTLQLNERDLNSTLPDLKINSKKNQNNTKKLGISNFIFKLHSTRTIPTNVGLKLEHLVG